MFIHQEANRDMLTLEGWINSDKIAYISKKHTGTTILYECYLIGDSAPLSITEETLNKIMTEKGVI